MVYTDTAGRRDYDRHYGRGTYPNDLERLEDLDGWELAEGEPDPRGYDLIGRDGEKIGTIKSLLASPTTEKSYFAIVDTGGWFQNKLFVVPLDEIRFNRDEGRAYGPFMKEQFRTAPEYREGDRDFTRYYTYWSGLHTGERREAAATHETEAATGEVRVPVMDETADVRREQHETGYVTLRKRADVETEHITEPVTRTRVTAETREVPAGEQYDYDANATTLREGEELRVPVVEEELVVEKRPRVTREVVVSTHQETEQVERDVDLRRERVEVDEEGDVEVERPTRRR